MRSYIICDCLKSNTFAQLCSKQDMVRGIDGISNINGNGYHALCLDYKIILKAKSDVGLQ